MIIGEYDTAIWNAIALSGLKTSDWNDSQFYPDKDFFDMVNVVVALPNINSEEVGSITLSLHLIRPADECYIINTGASFVWELCSTICER